jgi:hypothetical protein
MSELSKQALKVENNQSFPNNNTGYITPGRLRDFNVNMIDSLVDEITFNEFTQSVTASIEQLKNFSSSLDTNFASQAEFNSYTQSNDARVTALVNATSSYATSAITASSLITASFNNGTRNLTFTKGDATTFAVNIPDVSGSAGDFVTTSSFNAFTQSIDGRVDSLEAATSSYATSAITASSLITASLSGNTITFTKGDNSTFGFTIPDVSGSTINTGSFATTGSNTFNGNQIVNGYVSASNGYFSNENITAFNVSDGSNIRFWSGSVGGTEFYNIQLVPGVGDIAFSRSGAGNVKTFTLAGVAGNNTTFQNNPVVFNDSVSSLTVNAQSTAISGSGSYTLQASTISQTAVNATTTATSSVRGTFDITGQSGGDGRVIMLGHSGSLVLGNSGVNTYYGALAHLSSSAANANTNLIFKTNTNTADTIISGSGNIFTNPSAPTAGFKRYMTTGNIAIAGSGASVPQISGSMAWSPTISNNLFLAPSTPLTWRGPASASASTVLNNVIAGGAINLGLSAANHFERAAIGVNVTGNLVAGAINAIASKTPLSSSIAIGSNIIGGTATLAMDSSSIGFNGNSVQGGLTINNSYLPNTTTGTQHVTSINGGLYIGTHTIYASGSNTAFTGNPGRTITNAVMLGTNNVISASLNADLAQVASTSLIGQGLIVVGSNSKIAGASAADWGSVFVGRWNSIDGTKDMTGETVFAVGTGTGASTRKTGFLIDSGSNTFVEGTLNVSGSTSMTGSLTIQSGSGDLYIHGHKQFNCGAWQDLTIQSGSADTAYAFKFDTVDVLDGVILSGSTGLQTTAAGIYNIQWSGQLVQGASSADVTVWLRKNGTDIPGTGGQVTMASNTKLLPAWNYMLELNTNDVIELMWGSNSSSTTWAYIPATGIYPACASIIATVSQVR